MSKSFFIRTRVLLWKVILLLGSGAVTSLFLSLISSPAVSFDREFLKSLFLTLQWYNFSLTFVKGGLENEIFSITLNGKYASFRKAVFTGLIPSVLICFIGSFLTLKNGLSIASLLLSIALILDSISVYSIAQFNAVGRYSVATVANFLNYPSFIILLIIFAKDSSSLGNFNVLVSVFFLFASAMRLCFLLWKRKELPRDQNTSVVVIKPKLSLIIYQCLNYILFKADVIILSLFSGLEKDNFPLTDKFIYYIFLSQFVDVWAGLITSLSPLANKRYVSLDRAFSWRDIGWRDGIIYAIILTAIFPSYVFLFYRQNAFSIPIDFMALIWIRSLLSLPVNLKTYSMISLGLAASLTKKLSLSIFVGTSFYLVFVICLYKTGINFLPYCIITIVPLQLAIFLFWKNKLQLSSNNTELK